MSSDMIWKHCNDCNNHWEVDDYLDDYVQSECPRCGSDNVEPCFGGDCARSFAMEDDLVSVADYKGTPIRVKEEREIEGKKQDVEYDTRELSINKCKARLGHLYGGYRLLGYGWKDDDAKTVLELTPKNKLRMSSGNVWNSRRKEGENTIESAERTGVTLSSFGGKFTGGNTGIHQYADVLELFRDFNGENGLDTVIWDETNGPPPGAEAFIKKLQGETKPGNESYGGKSSSDKRKLEELEKQHRFDEEEKAMLRAKMNIGNVW